MIRMYSLHYYVLNKIVSGGNGTKYGEHFCCRTMVELSADITIGIKVSKLTKLVTSLAKILYIIKVVRE